MSDLNKTLQAINKKFGDDTARFLTKDYVPDIKCYPTGSLMLDLALGRGGIPRGRIVEVFGESMSGKTTLSFLYMAEVQKQNEGKVVFVDAEHAFDPKLAKEYGLDLDDLILITPKTAENAIDSIEALIRTGEVRAITIDSVSALTPTKIEESSMEQQTMGLLARLMSTAMQKLNGIAYQYDCTLIFINQVREKMVLYGDNKTTSGGRALPFYSSVRLHVKRGEAIKNKDEIIGHFMRVKVQKNKVGIPFKEATFPLLYGIGVDRADEIAQMSVYAGLIRKAGAWFRYEDENGEVLQREGNEMKFQGQANFSEYLSTHPTFLNELESRLRGVEVDLPTGEPLGGHEDAYVVEDASK